MLKSATDAEIKKAYKKLALQFHPDENKAPDATDAFKAIGKAFAILSDPQTHKYYDDNEWQQKHDESDDSNDSNDDFGYYDDYETF